MKHAKEEHFVGKVAQKAIIKKADGQILLARDFRDPDTWELPGGRLNVDELPASGLARELYEELGVDVEVGNIVFARQFWHQADQANTLLLVYESTLKDESKDFSFGPDEIAEVKWITEQELDHQHIFEDLREALEHYFRVAK